MSQCLGSKDLHLPLQAGIATKRKTRLYWGNIQPIPISLGSRRNFQKSLEVSYAGWVTHWNEIFNIKLDFFTLAGKYWLRIFVILSFTLSLFFWPRYPTSDVQRMLMNRLMNSTKNPLTNPKKKPMANRPPSIMTSVEKSLFTVTTRWINNGALCTFK